MTHPPTGTITFLFTDIEGSTRRWEAQPSVMSRTLARHDTILRSAIEGAGGYVFKTVGDAFCAAFSVAQDAVRAALDAQHALHAERWPQETGEVKVRMALHSGSAEERGGDYFGPPVNRVARLLSAGHGGQVLLSQATYDLVRDQLPADASTEDMGERRLKDLYRPERVYSLLAPGLPSHFPPLKTLDTRPNNLPVRPTPIVGREKEIASAVALLRRQDVRLVTLSGPGGTGKTRLSLQLGADLLDYFQDGTYFVNLAPVTDPDLVAPSIAQALGVQEAARTPLLDTLKAYLAEKEILLILDNFEQVTPAASQVASLLSAAPRLKVIVTSRELLHIRGEHNLPVPPLELPEPGVQVSARELGEFESVRLFVERAVEVKPDFELTEGNAEAVAEICRRLDGLPLAIELAAARLKILPPAAMLSRLQSRLKLLTGGARDLPDRQQTLRNAIEWSYDLLDEGDKQLFRRLAVFQGGRTLEAIEAVCATPDSAPLEPLSVDALDGTESLVSKSLLQQREGYEGEPRYVMLETIYEYAREKMEESGEAPVLRQVHAAYFAAFAEEAERALRGPRQVDWLARLEAENGNFRAALGWAEAGGEEGNASDAAAAMGLRLAGALGRFWFARGHLSEGRRYLEAILTLTKEAGGNGSLRAKALNTAGRLAVLQGDYEAARCHYDDGLALARAAGDKTAVANLLNDMGNLRGVQGDYVERKRLHEEALVLFRETGDRAGIASSQFQIGNVLLVEGNYEAGRDLIEQSVAILRQLGDKRGIAMSLYVLGNVERSQGDPSRALRYYDEGQALFRELGDRWSIANLLVNTGNVAASLDDLPRARELLEEGQRMFRDLGARRGMADALMGLGEIACREDDFPAAEELFRQGLEARRDLGNKLGVIECLESLAEVAAAGGRDERALVLFGAAETHRAAIMSPMHPSEREEYERRHAEATERAGAAASGHLESGRGMTLEQATAYALAKND